MNPLQHTDPVIEATARSLLERAKKVIGPDVPLDVSDFYGEAEWLQRAGLLADPASKKAVPPVGQIRVSPDGTAVAIKTPEPDSIPWATATMDGCAYNGDDDVEDWGIVDLDMRVILGMDNGQEDA